MNSIDVQVSSVNRIPKPKPKVEKKPAKEEANKEKTDSSESASSESESTEKPSESDAPEKNNDSEPESHDELWLLESAFEHPWEILLNILREDSLSPPQFCYGGRKDRGLCRNSRQARCYMGEKNLMSIAV